MTRAQESGAFPLSSSLVPRMVILSNTMTHLAKFSLPSCTRPSRPTGSSDGMGAGSFPHELLTRTWPERLAYFQAYTIAHPALIAAKEKLSAAIHDSAPNSLILVL